MTILIVCFGFPFIIQAYCMSFVFKTASSAAKMYILMQIFVFYILPFILVNLLREKDLEIPNKIF